MNFAALAPRPKAPARRAKAGTRRPFTRELGVMPKLEVGDANHPLERQADAIADFVMQAPMPRRVESRGPREGITQDHADRERGEDGETLEDELSDAPTPLTFGGAAAPPDDDTVTRECASCASEDDRLHRMFAGLAVFRGCASCQAEDDELHRACTSCESEDESIDRACASCEAEDEELRRETAAGERGGSTSDAFSARVRGRLGAGRALPRSARSFLEPRLGLRLDRVRIHDDHAARSLARRINARAFSFRQHIFFAANEFRPQSQAGMRLLAHEVAHTLQHRGLIGGRSREEGRSPALRRSPENEPAVETKPRTAEAMGDDDLGAHPELVGKVEALIGDLHHHLENATFILDAAGIPDKVRKKAQKHVREFRRIWRTMVEQKLFDAAVLSQWIDAGIRALRALDKALTEAQTNTQYGETAGYIKRDSKELRKRAYQLRRHEFFKRGRAWVEDNAEAQEAASIASKQAELDQQLGHLRRETEADWMARPEKDIRAELDKLRDELESKKMASYLGDAEAQATARWEVRVLETRIDVLVRLVDELDIEPGPESPSVILKRWWKMTDQGQNTRRLAQLALPYARRGGEHDLWVLETLMEWLWRSKDEAAEFARHFVRGLGEDRPEVFARMQQSRHGRAVLMSLRMKLDKDLVFGGSYESLRGHFTGEATTEELNSEFSASITDTLGDAFSQDDLKTRLNAGESPALKLTLGALSTRIDADVVNDRVRITAGYDVARAVGVPDLIGSGLYLDPNAIVRLYYKNTHELRFTTAAHLGDVVKGELDKSLPWKIDTEAVAEGLVKLAAAQVKKAESAIVPAIWHFADNVVPATYRPEARSVASAAEATVKALLRIVMYIAGLGIGLTTAAIEMIKGLVQIVGVVLDIVNALLSVEDPRTVWPLIVKGIKSVPGMVDKAVMEWAEKFMVADEYEAAGMVGLLVGKVIQAIVEAMEMVQFVKKAGKLLFGGFRKARTVDAPHGDFADVVTTLEPDDLGTLQHDQRSRARDNQFDPRPTKDAHSKKIAPQRADLPLEKRLETSRNKHRFEELTNNERADEATWIKGHPETIQLSSRNGYTHETDLPNGHTYRVRDEVPPSSCPVSWQRFSDTDPAHEPWTLESFKPTPRADRNETVRKARENYLASATGQSQVEVAYRRYVASLSRPDRSVIAFPDFKDAWDEGFRPRVTNSGVQLTNPEGRKRKPSAPREVARTHAEFVESSDPRLSAITDDLRAIHENPPSGGTRWPASEELPTNSRNFVTTEMEIDFSVNGQTESINVHFTEVVDGTERRLFFSSGSSAGLPEVPVGDVIWRGVTVGESMSHQVITEPGHPRQFLPPGPNDTGVPTMSLSEARARYGSQFTAEDPKDLRALYAHSETALFEMLETKPEVVNDAVVEALLERQDYESIDDLRRDLGGKVRVEKVTFRLSSTRSVCSGCERGIARLQGKALLDNASADVRLFHERHPGFSIVANDALDDQLFQKGGRLTVETPSSYFHPHGAHVANLEKDIPPVTAKSKASDARGHAPASKSKSKSNSSTGRTTTPEKLLKARPDDLAPPSRPLCVWKK